MRLLPIILATTILLVAGCDDNPDERTLLSGPRLLSVRSTPPALRGLDGVVTLDALALSGDGEVLEQSAVGFRVCSPWRFLVDPERDCPASSALIPSGRELTTQQLLAFYPPPAGTGDGYPSGDSPEGPSCGNSAVIEVPVLAEVTIDGASLLTVKRIPIYLDETDKHNPELEPVEIAMEEDGIHTLSLSVEPASLDMECRNEVVGLEAIRIYVYSTSGSFEESSIDIVPTPEGDVSPAQLQWMSSGEPALLVFVAVDNDGGVDWQTLSL